MLSDVQSQGDHAADTEKNPEDSLQRLQVKTIKIHGATEAEIHWEGLDIAAIKSCEYAKRVNQSEEVQIVQFLPTNLTLRLTKLKPYTKYNISLTCFDTKGNTYKSPIAGFTTSKLVLFTPWSHTEKCVWLIIITSEFEVERNHIFQQLKHLTIQFVQTDMV